MFVGLEHLGKEVIGSAPHEALLLERLDGPAHGLHRLRIAFEESIYRVSCNIFVFLYF